MTEERVKLLRDDEVDNERCIKVKRHDIDIAPTADVDAKLAEKLDSLLKIDNPHKSRFKTNKPRPSQADESRTVTDKTVSPEQTKLIQRNLTKEELKERLIKKYDTLVPELDPKRTKVKVVEIFSANESIRLGKDQARKQLQRELEINSVSGNQSAYKTGLKAFKFNDGYELTMKNFATKRTDQNELASKSSLSSALKNKCSGSSTKPKASKSVGFSDNVSQMKDVRDDDESDYDDDDLTESDCSSADD